MRSFTTFTNLYNDVHDPTASVASHQSHQGQYGHLMSSTASHNSHLSMGHRYSTASSYSTASHQPFDYSPSPFGYSPSESSIAEESYSPVNYQISVGGGNVPTGTNGGGFDGDRSPRAMSRSFSNMSNLPRLDERSSVVSRDSVMSQAQAPAGMHIAVHSSSSRNSNQSNVPIGFRPSTASDCYGNDGLRKPNQLVTPMKLNPGVQKMLSNRQIKTQMAQDDGKDCLS